MIPTSVEIEPLTNKIIGCAIEVHRNLGPGLLESIYQDCLIEELADAKLKVESGRAVPLFYKGRRLKEKLKLDLLVQERRKPFGFDLLVFWSFLETNAYAAPPRRARRTM